jgi:hypothetical protein
MLEGVRAELLTENLNIRQIISLCVRGVQQCIRVRVINKDKRAQQWSFGFRGALERKVQASFVLSKTGTTPLRP